MPRFVFTVLGDQVVLDVIRHPRMFDSNRLGPDEGPPSLERWTVDRLSGKVVEERLDDRGQEFPRVDERLVGRRHRYGYAGAFLEHETAKTELKALMPEDAKEAIGHGVRAKRTKSGAVSFDSLTMEGGHAPGQ